MSIGWVLLFLVQGIIGFIKLAKTLARKIHPRKLEELQLEKFT